RRRCLDRCECDGDVGFIFTRVWLCCGVGLQFWLGFWFWFWFWFWFGLWFWSWAGFDGRREMNRLHQHRHRLIQLQILARRFGDHARSAVRQLGIRLIAGARFLDLARDLSAVQRLFGLS